VQQEKSLVAVKMILTRYLATISTDNNYKCNEVQQEKIFVAPLVAGQKVRKTP
jgi:hypothetical protein